jgi:hypothetical protein
LTVILPRFGVKDLPEDVSRSLNFAWHRLDVWPDVTQGLTRLGNDFLLAPVSNGNISLMVDLARRNRLHFDAMLGAEIAGDYNNDFVVSRCRSVGSNSSALSRRGRVGSEADLSGYEPLYEGLRLAGEGLAVRSGNTHYTRLCE